LSLLLLTKLVIVGRQIGCFVAKELQGLFAWHMVLFADMSVFVKHVLFAEVPLGDNHS